MFGIEDLIGLSIRGYGMSEPDYPREEIFKTVVNADSRKSWICIMPAFVFGRDNLKKEIVSRESSAIIYRLPKDIVTTSPSATRRVLDLVYQDASNEIKNLKQKGSEINLAGISIGGTIAFKLANKFHPKNLVCLTPGADLPISITQSLATKPIYEESIRKGYTFSDFKNQLDDFSPINNLDNLDSSTQISLHLGVWDRMIPYVQGKLLADKLKSTGLKPQVRTRYFFGHTFTILSYRGEKSERT